jgi:hypothetical protein
MFQNYNLSDKVRSESIKKREDLLNSKIYFLNKSSTKFVTVGISIDDFSPKIHISGQNGYKISINEDEWKSLVKYEGVISNYFYSFTSNFSPIKLGNISIYFENYNEIPILKIQKNGEYYVLLSTSSVFKLFEIKDIIDYRLQVFKKQDFVKYFNTFQQGLGLCNEDLLSTVQNVLNYKENTNSENVSTMMEFLFLYPNELEYKFSNGFKKRKYYEEYSNF